MSHHQHQHQIEDDDEDPWMRAEKDVRHKGPFLTQQKMRKREKTFSLVATFLPSMARVANFLFCGSFYF